MMEEYQSYIITSSLDTHTFDFEELKYMRANITALRLIDPTSFDITNGWMSTFLRVNFFPTSCSCYRVSRLFPTHLQQFMIGFKARDEINDISKSLPNMSKWKRHFIMVRKQKIYEKGKIMWKFRLEWGWQRLTYFFCDLSINHFRINGYRWNGVCCRWDMRTSRKKKLFYLCKRSVRRAETKLNFVNLRRPDRFRIIWISQFRVIFRIWCCWFIFEQFPFFWN